MMSNMTLPYIDMESTGLNIRRLMNNAGITVKQVQKVMGFNTPSAIYPWLDGRHMPTIDNLVVLAKILGVTIDDIVIVKGGDKNG